MSVAISAMTCCAGVVLVQAVEVVARGAWSPSLAEAGCDVEQRPVHPSPSRVRRRRSRRVDPPWHRSRSSAAVPRRRRRGRDPPFVRRRPGSASTTASTGVRPTSLTPSRMIAMSNDSRAGWSLAADSSTSTRLRGTAQLTTATCRSGNAAARASSMRIHQRSSPSSGTPAAMLSPRTTMHRGSGSAATGHSDWAGSGVGGGSTMSSIEQPAMSAAED